MKKLKTYLLSSVWLSHVPSGHASSNGGRQFTVLVRAKNKKDVVEILGGNKTLYSLNQMGFEERDENDCLGYTEKVRIGDIVKKDRTIYYYLGHTKNGYGNQWLEYNIDKTK